MEKEDEKIVINLIKGLIKLENFPKEDFWKEDLTSIGFESILAIELIVAIEEKFCIEFDEEFLTPDKIYNFNKICDYIKTKNKVNKNT